MATPQQNSPSYLKGARPVQQIQQNTRPSFLEGAKPVNQKPSRFEDENELEREIERNQARLTSRGIETIAGLPGDIQGIISHFTGHKFETEFPTSSGLQEKAEKYGQGYLTAKNEYEKKSDVLARDISSMMIPGTGSYGMLRNIGIPLLGNIAKEGLEQTGAMKDAEGAKMGLMLALDLMSHKKARGGGARELGSKLFGEFEQQVSQGGNVNVGNLTNSLDALEASLSKGGTRPSTSEALKKISELKGKIINGQLDVREAYPFRASINEIVDSLGGFEFGGMPKKIKERAVNNLNEVKGKVISSVEDWAQQNNPDALKTWRNANEVYRVTEESNKIANFMTKSAKNLIKDPYIKGLFGALTGGGAIYHPSALATTGGIGLGAYTLGKAALKSGSLLYRIAKSPTLANHYAQIVKAAAQGNAPIMIRNMKELRDGLKKDYKEKD